MKNIIYCLACIIASIGNLNSQTIDHSSALNLRASNLLEECISFNETAGVTGAMWKDGVTIWKDGKGYADIENNVKAEANMVNRLASISKPMTAIAILQLWEDGKLKLDDPVKKHLPSFPSKHDAITINHLLNHTSGIKAYKNRAEAFPTKQYDKLTDAVAVFQNRSLANEPGNAYQYTTYGYVVLGAIIEAVSGMDYRSYMKENVWKVAGMENTDVEIFGQEYQNKSKLYIKTGSQFSPDIQTNLSVKVPGGGIQSTVEDLLKFGEAVINHDLITAETFELMITDSGKKKAGNPYAMGWFLYGKEGGPNGRVIGHSGSQSGTSTQFMIYLDHNLIVATLANTNGAWNTIIGMNGKLAQLAIDPASLDVPIFKAIPLTATVLDRYTGNYDSEDGKNIEVYRRGNSLFGLKEGLEEVELFASAENKFFVRSLDLQVEFDSDGNRNANGMTLSLGGEVTAHNKIDFKKSIGRELYNVMVEKDSKAGRKWFNRVKENSGYKIDGEAMNQTGFALINVGQIKEALEVFRLNDAAFPNNSTLINEEVMIDVGNQLLSAGHKDLAFDYYKFNLEVYPESWKAYQSLGNGYFEIGKKKKALKMLKKAAKLNSEDADLRAKIEMLTGAN